MKAGDEDAHRKIFQLLRAFSPDKSTNSRRSFSRTFFSMRSAQRPGGALERLVHVSLFGDHRLETDVVNARETRPLRRNVKKYQARC